MSHGGFFESRSDRIRSELEEGEFVCSSQLAWKEDGTAAGPSRAVAGVQAALGSMATTGHTSLFKLKTSDS